MIRSLLEVVDSRIAILASANLSLAGMSGLLVGLEPYLSFAVKLGQLAVAVVTVVYIIFKTRAVRRMKRDDE